MSNQKRIARITYNTKGWVEPSGKEGKSKSKDTYEGKKGFGHEEWLFDFSRTRRGFNYGFIEGIFKDQTAYEGKTFDLYLFTINHTDLIRSWAAVIHNCYVLTEEESKELSSFFNERSEINQRVRQLEDLGLGNGTVTRDLTFFRPVVRFKRESVEHFEPMIPIDDPYIKNLNRYKLFHWMEGTHLEQLLTKKFTFKPSPPNEPLRKTINARYSAKSKEITQVHKDISKALYQVLILNYGVDKIGCDQPTGLGTYIDIVRKTNTEFVLYEIKTYVDLRKNIREAFGQLMEYGYYSSDIPTKEMIIISDLPVTTEAAGYLKAIRSKYKIPLFYQHFDLTKKNLSEKY